VKSQLTALAGSAQRPAGFNDSVYDAFGQNGVMPGGQWKRSSPRYPASNVTLIGGNGDNTSRSGAQYATLGSQTMGVADFNGDGILALAIPTYGSSSFALLLGNGDGTFWTPVNVARGVAVGDFDGDGRLDVAVGNQFANSISIFLQTSGTGVGPVVTLTPASVSFPLLRTVGTTSLPNTVKLTNVGGGELDVSGVTVTGPDGGDFARSNNCPPTVASGASCVITLTFKPTAQGLRTASVSIADKRPRQPADGSADGPWHLPRVGAAEYEPWGISR
jgi:hypothetical protein